MKRTSYILFAVFLLLFGSVANAQVTVTSSDSLSCSTNCTTLTAHLEGDIPTNAGITSDDVYSVAHDIGFTFNFYGTNYTQCLIGANGTLDFNLSDAGAYDPYTVDAALLGNTEKLNSICGPWCDIDIFYTGTAIGTETYSTDGVAPNRKFVVTWCNCSMFSCGTQRITTQIIIYETTNIVEVHIAKKQVCTGWEGGHAIVGVQNAAGDDAVTAPGRDYPSVWAIPPTEAWRFVPNATATSYTVSSIPYAPVPYSTSSLYWYNATTGAYLGTGASQVVCPTTPTLYKCGALGCSDTSYGYYLVSPTDLGPTLTLDPVSPAMCGVCNGSITIHGMTAGLYDTLNYTFNGVAQPQAVVLVAADGTITLNSLCPGIYDNFIVKQAACASPPAGPVTLAFPPIAITTVDTHDPSYCGGNDGSLVIHGLYPSHPFTITYTFNGVAQPPYSGSTDATGAITIPNLSSGVYDNIIASFGDCTTAAVGPYTLIDPPPPPVSIITYVDPSTCGKPDGSITIKAVKPYSSDTIYYSKDGVPQTPIITNALADSSIFLPGLYAGTYSAMSVKIGNCVATVTNEATLVDSPLHINFTDAIHYGCGGDTVVFSNGSYAHGAPVLNPTWNYGDGVSDTVTSPNHIYAQGTYTVTLIATNGYCIDSAKVPVSLVHPLTAAFSPDPNIACQNKPFTFTNTSAGEGTLTYKWAFGNGATDTVTNSTYTYPNSGTYNVQLIATNFIPCSDTAYHTIYVDTQSRINLLITDSVLCAGSYVTFTAQYASIGYTGITWDFGDWAGDSSLNVNPVMHAYDAPGSYVVTATAHYRACDGVSTTRSLTIQPQPSIYLGPDTSICIGSESMVLFDGRNDASTGATWRWSTGETGNHITVVAPGYYYATVNINNCYASDSILVSNDCYMDIPNAFTPNGDGVNDYFYPRQYLTKGLTSFSMNIYNRWGQLVFATTTLDGRGWDGRFNNVEQPDGVYVYIIDATFRDGQKEHHQGNITLMR